MFIVGNFIGAPTKIFSADICKFLLYYLPNDHLSSTYNVGIMQDLCFYLHQYTHSQTMISTYSTLGVFRMDIEHAFIIPHQEH